MTWNRAVLGVLLVGLGLALSLAWAGTSAAQVTCAAFCLTVGPDGSGATELRVTWGSVAPPTTVAAYQLARVSAAGLTSELVSPGPGSRVEPAPTSPVCFILVPVAYVGKTPLLRSPAPVCYAPVAGPPAPVRLTLGVPTPCELCPTMSDRLSAERTAGTSAALLVGVPLPGTGSPGTTSPQMWAMPRSGSQFSTSGLSGPGCYAALTTSPVPQVTGLVCSLGISVPALVSDLPTLTPTPLPPTITPILTPVATVAAGTNPTGIAINPSTNRIYVADQEGRAVVVIDAAAGAVLTRIPLAGQPGQLAVDAEVNRVFVATRDVDALVVIDGHTNAVLGTVPVALPPTGVAVQPATHRAYVSAYKFAPGVPAYIVVVDGLASEAVALITTPCCPTDLAVSPDASQLYALNSPSMTGYRIDLASNTVLDTFPAGSVPNDIAVDRTHHRLYVLRALGEIGVIDTDRNAQVAAISLGGPLAPGGPVSSWVELAGNEATQRLYALGYNFGATASGRLWIADGASGQVRGSVPAGYQPSGVAVHPVTGLVYVVDGKTLFVIRDSQNATEAQVQQVIRLE